jgi:hypothetical protein
LSPDAPDTNGLTAENGTSLTVIIRGGVYAELTAGRSAAAKLPHRMHWLQQSSCAAGDGACWLLSAPGGTLWQMTVVGSTVAAAACDQEAKPTRMACRAIASIATQAVSRLARIGIVRSPVTRRKRLKPPHIPRISTQDGLVFWASIRFHCNNPFPAIPATYAPVPLFSADPA